MLPACTFRNHYHCLDTHMEAAALSGFTIRCQYTLRDYVLQERGVVPVDEQMSTVRIGSSVLLSAMPRRPHTPAEAWSISQVIYDVF